jgi:hypothetical protein
MANDAYRKEIEDALIKADQANNSDDAVALVAELNRLDSQVDPSAGQIVGGLGAEVGISMAGQMAGTALAPMTLGISYPVLAFSSGVGGNLAAQKIEGRETPSWGRALFAGAVNLIPGAKAVKGTETALKAVGREAFKGAALGVGEATTTALVDEQRKPTLEEVASYGGAGAAFGGLFGAAIRGGSGLWNKVKNKSSAQVDDMVARGEIDPLDLVPASSSELNANPDIANAERRSIEDMAIKFRIAKEQEVAVKAMGANTPSLLLRGKELLAELRASIIPSRVVGKQATEDAIALKNSVLAYSEIGSKIGKRVDDAIAENANPAEAKAAIENFLTSKTYGPLPKSLSHLEVDLSMAREKTEELQTKLLNQIDLGITPDSDGLRSIIAKSKDEGDYLTREFRFFTDSNYRPTKDQREAARQSIISINVSEGATVADATQRSDNYLASLDQKKVNNVSVKDIYPSAIDGFVRERKNLTPELLDYLGELTSPGERIRGTLTRVAKGVERDAADARIKQDLVTRGVAKNTPEEGYVELSLRRREPGGSKLFVPRDVQVAMNNIYLDGGDMASANLAKDTLTDLWTTGVAVSKATKVLLNPPSYAVQVYGNIANLIGMGVNPMAGAGRGLALTLSEYGPVEKLVGASPESRRKLLTDVMEMTKYGIKGANIIDSDLRSGLQGGIVGKGVQKALDPFSKAYTIPDTIGRFVAWKSNQNALKRIFPQAGEDTIKEYAARTTNDTYQNYDRLSSLARHSSTIGLTPQFASFTMEFVRNQYNQGRIVKEMIAGQFGRDMSAKLGQVDYTAMRLEGMRRLAGLSMVYGGTYAAIKGWNAEHNVDEVKYQALKETVLPEYDNDRIMAVTLSPDGKMVKYANPSYVIPHALGLSAFEAGMSGAPINTLASLISEEFIGEGTFVGKAAYGAVNNLNLRTGQPISSETDKYKKAKEQVEFFVRESFTPGGFRELDKLASAMRGQGGLTVADVARRQLGVRVNTSNIEEAAMFRVKAASDNAKQAKSDYRVAKEYRNLSPQDLEAVYQKANASRADAMAEVKKHATNMGKLGFSEELVIATLKKAGVGSTDILDTLDGIVTNIPKVERRTATVVWEEEILPLGPKERRERISSIAKNDPQMARSLDSRMRDNMRAGAAGITNRDSLVMGLGVADGSRAAYINRKMQQSPNPESVLSGYKTKRILTPEVERDVRLLQVGR